MTTGAGAYRVATGTSVIAGGDGDGCTSTVGRGVDSPVPVASEMGVDCSPLTVGSEVCSGIGVSAGTVAATVATVVGVAVGARLSAAAGSPPVLAASSTTTVSSSTPNDFARIVAVPSKSYLSGLVLDRGTSLPVPTRIRPAPARTLHQ